MLIQEETLRLPHCANQKSCHSSASSLRFKAFPPRINRCICEVRASSFSFLDHGFQKAGICERVVGCTRAERSWRGS